MHKRHFPLLLLLVLSFNSPSITAQEKNTSKRLGRKTTLHNIYTSNPKSLETRIAPKSINDQKDLGIIYFDIQGRKIRHEAQFKTDSIRDVKKWVYNEKGQLIREVDIWTFGRYDYQYDENGNRVERFAREYSQ